MFEAANHYADLKAVLRFDNLNGMSVESRIHALSEQLVSCKNDSEALKLAQELQILLHEQIEQLRKKVSAAKPKVTGFRPHN